VIPVRYWPMHDSEIPVADVFNSGNFMFWHPGPAPWRRSTKGWQRNVKNRHKHYGIMPYASFDWIKGSGVKGFLRRRAVQLPRTGGFFLVGIKTSPPVGAWTFHSFSMGLAHYRHRGPSSPLDFEMFCTQEKLPRGIRQWFPAELPG
jgi:hypothetical protein